MDIELKTITVRELTNGYANDAEEGVTGYGGKLDIRPKYQREFVYANKQRDAVIDSVRRGYPLNTMYWANNSNGNFEVLDGQQRTISLCEYVAGNFSIKNQFFHNLETQEQDHILDYPLLVYMCEGSDREKLNWFETINIAGEKLTAQELRNAVYTGAWLADAKRHFSKTGCAAFQLSKDYVKGSPIRQQLLEKALKWISSGDIENYMAKHQHSPNAGELWLYYQSVINWVKVIFPTLRKKEMQAVDWGLLYNEYKDKFFDSRILEDRIKGLMMDDDVTKKSGIYAYLITDEEKWLSIRAFTDNQKREAFERQEGVCPITKKKFDSPNEMHADHITPWSKGGRTSSDNLQMLDPTSQDI